MLDNNVDLVNEATVKAGGFVNKVGLKDVYRASLSATTYAHGYVMAQQVPKAGKRKPFWRISIRNKDQTERAFKDYMKAKYPGGMADEDMVLIANAFRSGFKDGLERV